MTTTAWGVMEDGGYPPSPADLYRWAAFPAGVFGRLARKRDPLWGVTRDYPDLWGEYRARRARQGCDADPRFACDDCSPADPDEAYVRDWECPDRWLAAKAADVAASGGLKSWGKL